MPYVCVSSQGLAQVTYEDIRLASLKLSQWSERNRDILDVIESGRVNADCTIYIEKAAPVSDWDRLALASLCDALSCCANPRAVAWFTKLGVKF
jgi:hypothetical protein